MIKVNLSKDEYEYEIHSLVKAFYQGEVIKIVKDPELSLKGVSNEGDKEVKLQLDIDLQEQNISLKARKYYTEYFPEENEANKSKECPPDSYEVSRDILGINKKEYKNLLKRMLYKCLAELTKKELPWGTLTGVRPTKIALERLEKKGKDEEIAAYMRKEYLCSEEKIETSLKVAKRELELLEDMDYKKGYSIYIGIPFCPSTCLYCSFTSYSIEKYGAVVNDYLKALMKEITYAKSCYKDKILSTVYLGGGTPTTLSEEQLSLLLKHIRSTFDFSHVLEFTVEAGRPDSINFEKLQILKEYGVTRISINPQSMRQKTLDVIGRKHTVEQVINAFHMAREAGHDNINMDIILGLPGEGEEDVSYTLSEIDKLQPDSLTVHTLAIKRAARLNLEKENYQDMVSLQTSKMLGLTKEYVEKAGYLPYYLYRQKNMSDNLENIGYARYGKEGLYNILIMEEKQTILALGAGALSKFVFPDENRIERIENVKSLKDYIERIDEMIERKQNFLKENKR